MKDKHLYLFFPQWQGSGRTNEIFHGAHALEGCTEIDFFKVKLSINNLLVQKYNIFAFEQILEQFRNCKKIIEKNSPDYIFTLGGDCGVELAPISYLNKKYKKLAVIWLDAHGDLNTPLSSPSKNFHGMPLRTLLGEGDQSIVKNIFSKLKPNQIFLAGCRDLDKEEKHFIRQKTITKFAVRNKNNNFFINQLKLKGFKNIYIHLDLDVIDPEDMPYVKCPVPQGISVKNLIQIINELKDNFKLCGGSICEFTGKNTKSVHYTVNILKALFDY